MAVLSTVQVTTISGKSYYVPLSEFKLGNIPEQPDSVIYNYIIGSRGSMLRVNTLADLTGVWKYINPKLIEDMVPTFA